MTRREERGLIGQLANALHDMSQPLTALHCRLAMSKEKALQEDCLRECDRLSASIHHMHTLMMRARTKEEQGREEE